MTSSSSAAPARDRDHPPRVGLVLGAGGTVGQAYHAGALAALEHDLGWDARTVDLIVGTSAGSITGTLLRLGVPAHDLAAWAVKAPLSVESAHLDGILGGRRPQFPPISLHQWMRRWRLPPPELLSRLARRPWALRPSVVATTMMPPGEVNLLDHVDGLGKIDSGRWPDGLWVCAARRDDGQRVVFGAARSPKAPLDRGLAASCAIPGYFSPIEIGGVEYFDGGVHSPTNADVLVRQGLDLVIAIAPMSAAGGLPATSDALFRYAAHRRLERELGRLAAAGTTVVRIEPSRGTLDAMGVNMMAADRSVAVVQQAFLDTGRYTATPRIAGRLTTLGGRARGRAATA